MVAVSALKRYTQWDFIDWVNSHCITIQEKNHSQLFCQDKASVLLNALLDDCQAAGVEIRLRQTISDIQPNVTGNGFAIMVNDNAIPCRQCVIATGGLSIPTMGASAFAYRFAEKFQIPVHPVRAALVPFTLDKPDLERTSVLAGVSSACCVTHGDQSFTDDMLFTHRGLSGPAMLQISSYWQKGALSIDFMPDGVYVDWLQESRRKSAKRSVRQSHYSLLPKRLVDFLLPETLADMRLADLNRTQMQLLQQVMTQWCIQPCGTEGYRTAEVTLGGIDTTYISSKTMQVKHIPGLYFIGEALDITGWLGGYNFQWAWSSAWVAAQHLATV